MGWWGVRGVRGGEEMEGVKVQGVIEGNERKSEYKSKKMERG